jgi:putative hemolysin
VEFLILFVLILLNGFFAMSEIALVTAKKSKLLRMYENGNSSAMVAINLSEDPTKFLSTVQIGITSIGILNGIIGEAMFAESLSKVFVNLGLESSFSSILSTFLVVVVITYLSIVIGELIPKRIGQMNSESIACLVAKPITLLSYITKPFVLLLSLSTSLLMKLFSLNQKDSVLTEEEIHDVLTEGSNAGILEQQQHEMMRNVFRLDDIKLNSLMTPISEVVFIDTDDELSYNIEKVINSNHSKFPVCKGGTDNIIGFIYTRDILKAVFSGVNVDFNNIEKVVYIPEMLTSVELIDQFRENRLEMIFVVDEYGTIKGLITLKDLLEVVTGDFAPESEHDSYAIQRADGTWLFDGTTPIYKVKEKIELKSLKESEEGIYYTLSGLIMSSLGRMPVESDFIIIDDFKIEVVDMDGTKIDKVLIIKE